MDNLEITEIQYGPFLQYLKRDDITDVDFNGRDLWIRDVNVGRVKVTDQDVVEQLQILLWKQKPEITGSRSYISL